MRHLIQHFDKIEKIKNDPQWVKQMRDFNRKTVTDNCRWGSGNWISSYVGRELTVSI